MKKYILTRDDNAIGSYFLWSISMIQEYGLELDSRGRWGLRDEYAYRGYTPVCGANINKILGDKYSLERGEKAYVTPKITCKVEVF